jgi:hypothetical protein
MSRKKSPASDKGSSPGLLETDSRPGLFALRSPFPINAGDGTVGTELFNHRCYAGELKQLVGRLRKRSSPTQMARASSHEGNLLVKLSAQPPVKSFLGIEGCSVLLETDGNLNQSSGPAAGRRGSGSWAAVS